MQTQRLKILPDIVFDKIWTTASDYPDCEDYISHIMSSKKIFDPQKYGMDYVDAVNCLRQVHKYRNMPFAEILSASGARMSEIAHKFCIPVRTVQDWISGRRPSPSYINLMILRYYHLLDLGKYIRVRYSIDFDNNRPSIYEKRKTSDKTKSETINSAAFFENSDDFDDTSLSAKERPSSYISSLSDEDYENYLDALIEESKSKRSK